MPLINNDAQMRKWIDKLIGLVRPYKVYSGKIVQTGTDTPTITIYENTIGSIVWTRNSTGEFWGTLNSAFTEGKTICFPSSRHGVVFWDTNSGDQVYFEIYPASTSRVYIVTRSTTTELPVDDMLIDGFPFEIRVYK